MTSRGAQLFARLLGGLERLASRPLGALLLFLLACAAYTLRAVAWPLKAGRDLDEYVYAWVQLFDHDVLLPWSMLFRTPATPGVRGGVPRHLRRPFRRAADGAPLRRLDRLLGCRRAVLRSLGRDRRRRGSPPVPGLRPHVPRALERANVRCGVCSLGAPPHEGAHSGRQLGDSRSSASGSHCSRSFARETPF